jgi:hypothetical protein
LKVAINEKAIARCEVVKTIINTKAHQGTKVTSRREGKSKHENNKKKLKNNGIFLKTKLKIKTQTKTSLNSQNARINEENIQKEEGEK